MSVGLYKYDGDMYAGADEILSVGIASQRLYDTYLEPAIEELGIHFFQDGAEIRLKDVDTALKEVESLIAWVKENVSGDDKEHLLSNLKEAKEAIAANLENEEDVLYIF